LALKEALWFRRVDLLIAYLSSLRWGRSDPELSSLSSFQGPAHSKIAKVEWKLKENAESPFPVNVPDTLVAIGFMVKDSKRFPDSDSGGWGYAQFSHDPASDTYSADERYVGDARCGVACHAIVAAKDYVFTAYGRR
jgi:hypothetical protein